MAEAGRAVAGTRVEMADMKEVAGFWIFLGDGSDTI